MFELRNVVLILTHCNQSASFVDLEEGGIRASCCENLSEIRKKKRKQLKVVAATAEGASIDATIATALTEPRDILSFIFLALLLPGIGRNFVQLISSPQGIMRTNRKQLVRVSRLLIINLHGCA